MQHIVIYYPSISGRHLVRHVVGHLQFLRPLELSIALSITSISRSEVTGLVRKKLIPAASHSLRATSVAFAVSITKGKGASLAWAKR